MSDFIKSMLDISIFHLTDETRARMDADSRNYFLGKPCSLPFSVKGSSFGWFIDVRSAVERRCAKLPYPSDIVDCYELALRANCDYILFDRDAERHRALPWFGPDEQEVWDDTVPPHLAYDQPHPQRALLLNDLAADKPGMDI